MPENKFKAARKASDMTYAQAAEAAGLASSTYPLREKDPDDFRLRELKRLYREMTPSAKPLLKAAVNDIFSD